MGDDEYVKIFAPLFYRVADKFFKFLSWLLLIAAIKYTKQLTGSVPLFYLEIVGMFVFFWALIFQLAHVVVRDPVEWNIPSHLRMASKVLQVVVGFALLMIVMTPFFFLDPVIDSLVNARLPK